MAYADSPHAALLLHHRHSQSAARAYRQRKTARRPKAGTVEKSKSTAPLSRATRRRSRERDVFGLSAATSYATSRNAGTPFVYFIHGYGATADAYWKLMTVPDTADK